MGIPTDFFARICDDDGVCHCDWRLTIYGCEEEVHMRPLYIFLAVLSGVLSATSGVILYHRKVNLSQTILDWRMGFLRPKPIETLILFGMIFNLFRMIHAVIMVTDAAPNVAFRAFLFEIPWHYGIGAFACYFFGIAHTISESNKIIYDRWVGPPVVVNSITFIFLIGPHITNNICSIAAGVYALHGDIYHAEQVTNALYWLWTFYTICMGCLILYAGIRLLRLLRHHLLERKSDLAIENVKLGILKVKIIVVVGTTCLLLFGVMMIIYASRRVPIILVTAYNVALATIWLCNGVVSTSVILFGIVLNPRMATLANNFGSTGSDSIPPDEPLPAASKIETDTIVGMETGHAKWMVGDGSSGWNPTTREVPKPPENPNQIEVDQLHYNAMTNIVRSKQLRPAIDDYHHRSLHNDNDRSTVSSTAYLADTH